ncbi:MAG: hypothetical protein FWD64_13140, partial [Acidobacteriaceae bacterium]|nr:hypothetical protein [Acidobacteriaceae bacterium]
MLNGLSYPETKPSRAVTSLHELEGHISHDLWVFFRENAYIKSNQHVAIKTYNTKINSHKSFSSANMKLMFRLIFAAFMVCVTFSVPVSAALVTSITEVTTSSPHWTEVDTPHFEVFSDASRATAVSIAAHFEQ